jgi:hypothetical protein
MNKEELPMPDNDNGSQKRAPEPTDPKKQGRSAAKKKSK